MTIACCFIIYACISAKQLRFVATEVWVTEYIIGFVGTMAKQYEGKK
jgi:hypothetical protein